MGKKFRGRRGGLTRSERKAARKKRANQQRIEGEERKEIIRQEKIEQERTKIIEEYNLEGDTPYDTAKEVQRDFEEQKLYEFERKLLKLYEVQRKEIIRQEKIEQELQRKNKMRRQGLEERFSVDPDAPDHPNFEWFESLDQRIREASQEVEVKIKKEDFEYSLFLTEDGQNFRIYEIENGDEAYELIETNKARPIKRIRARAGNIEFLLNHSEFYKGIKYIREDGVPIYPNSDIHELCVDVFGKVETGIEIFPAKPSKKGTKKNGAYIIRAPIEKREPILRTYGQEHLDELCDEKPIQGKLLGSGDTALAFRFGDIVIIESADLNKATYIVTEDSFETIRHMPRAEAMRLSEEEGLVDRILHKDTDTETWKERITPHLNGDLEYSLTSEAENGGYER